MTIILHNSTDYRAPGYVPAPGGTLTALSPAAAAQRVLRARGRVLVFAAQGSSAELVRAWWPDLSAVAERDLWLDDTPNLTPAYLQAQLAAYAPVGLVVVDGWELLVLDGDELPARRDPRLLTALANLAQQWVVPVVVCGMRGAE